MNPSLAKTLVSGLAHHGVRQLFGIPGVHNTELYRHLSTFGIDVVLPRHEQGAGFMADGFARASGRPGVCILITGPGLTNAATAIGQAFSDSVPMLVISTVLPQSQSGKGRGYSHDMMDQTAAIRSIGVESFTLAEPSEVPEMLARAFARFATGRPRPVHLQIPLDRLLAEGPTATMTKLEATKPVPPQAAIRRAADLLQAAERPLVLAGGGAVDCDGVLGRFLDRSGAAVVTTIAAKGVVPEDDPRSLGATLPREATRAYLESCDLLLVLGSELSVTDLGPKGLPEANRTVRIDLDAQALWTNHQPDIALLGDAAATLELLNGCLPQKECRHDLSEIADARRRSKEEAHRERPGMRALLETIRERLPRDTLFALDMAEIAYLANEVFEAYTSRSWLHPVGFGTLGYALPAGIGAKLARPDCPVACFIGDYGFQYSLAELGVARERELPLLIYLWNNDKLHAIEKDMVRKQIAPLAVAALNPDFYELASAFGLAYACPASEELAVATGKALDSKGPSLIELRPAAFAA